MNVLWGASANRTLAKPIPSTVLTAPTDTNELFFWLGSSFVSLVDKVILHFNRFIAMIIQEDTKINTMKKKNILYSEIINNLSIPDKLIKASIHVVLPSYRKRIWTKHLPFLLNKRMIDKTVYKRKQSGIKRSRNGHQINA